MNIPAQESNIECACGRAAAVDSANAPHASGAQRTALPIAWREAAIFGALWGGVEITIGPLLYVTRLPLKGVFMSGLAIALLTASHMLIRRPWFPLRAAIICMLIRALAPDGLRIGLMFALLFQGFTVSLCFRLLRAALPAAIVAGFIATTASQIQSFVVKLITYGANFWELFVALLERAQRDLGLPPDSDWRIISLFLGIVGLAGGAAGVIGWRLGTAALKLRAETDVRGSA